MVELARRDKENVGTKGVDERHRFDDVALDAWMTTSIATYKGPIDVTQFKGGQSNPTFRLDTPAQSYVMRRKPFGKLLPSAHAVDREYRVISCLHAAGFPAPKTYGLCTDDSVIGAAFYIMDMVEGDVFWDQTLPDVARPKRRAIYEQAVLTLAKLHSYDPAAIGLGDFGSTNNYFVRQLTRWTKQYRASETEEIEAIEKLIDWLPRTVPEQDRVVIVHGDYRLDNMIFSPADDTKVVAVLDWELSTLGDPLADFSYFLMQWIPTGRSFGLADANLEELNIPSLSEAIALYCKAAGRLGIPQMDWYFAFNLFRAACIAQGIAGRVRDGTAASARAVENAARVRPLADAAWKYAMMAGAPARAW